VAVKIRRDNSSEQYRGDEESSPFDHSEENVSLTVLSAAGPRIALTRDDKMFAG